jgi:hypothetical protein
LLQTLAKKSGINLVFILRDANRAEKMCRWDDEVESL